MQTMPKMKRKANPAASPLRLQSDACCKRWNRACSHLRLGQGQGKAIH